MCKCQFPASCALKGCIRGRDPEDEQPDDLVLEPEEYEKMLRMIKGESDKPTVLASADEAEEWLAFQGRSVLDQAHELVEGHRGKDYGHPWEDFNRTAGLWNALFAHKLSSPFTASDVAAAMRMVKESRLQHTPDHRDSLVDICGYARTQEMVWEREHKNP